VSDEVAVSADLADSGEAAPAVVHPIAPMQPRTALLLASVLAAVVLFAVMVLLPVPYAILSAGPATDTLGQENGKPLIAVSGRETFPTSGKGRLFLTTVRIFGGPGSRVSVWQLLSAWLDGGQAVVPEEAIFPRGETAAQTQQENQQEMVSSQESATAAALRLLGYPINPRVRIVSFLKDSVSAAVLQPKDVVMAVGGAPTPDPASLKSQLQKVAAGQPATVTVRRGGKEQTLSVPTQKTSSGATALGIMVQPIFDFPFDVRIQIENVGGPSAGTMFALGIVDKLTPGALTGDQPIAGTGTIDPDGTVGPIGGIRQKLIGARESGARFFLAPAMNCPDVVGHVPDGLSVVKIATLAQARDAVAQIGQGKGTAGLPSCG
jgi:Lon-like protease